MIYTITTFQADDFDALSRTVGYFNSVEEAYAVIENGAHLHECLYEYALIESVQPGLYPHTECVAWFKWNNTTRAWDKMADAPHNMSICCNFSMG